jgi:hypothetical protein
VNAAFSPTLGRLLLWTTRERLGDLIAGASQQTRTSSDAGVSGFVANALATREGRSLRATAEGNRTMISARSDGLSWQAAATDPRGE